MAANNTDQHDEVMHAKRRAKTYQTLAMIFNQRPDAMLVNNIKAMGQDFIDLFLQRSDLRPDVQEGLSEISGFVEQIKDQPDKAVEQSLQVDWTRLFRGVQPGYGPRPPYEGVYLGEDENNFKVLESVARFYVQHGVIPAANAGNRPDYIGLELDFLGYMCDQQTDAWEKGDENRVREYQTAEDDFLKNHLGRWGTRYCDCAIEEAKTAFYRGFSRLTKGMIQEMANIP